MAVLYREIEGGVTVSIGNFHICNMRKQAHIMKACLPHKTSDIHLLSPLA